MTKRALFLIAAVCVPAAVAVADQAARAPAAWQVVNVSDDQQTLELAWDHNTCERPNERVTTEETPDDIRIAIDRDAPSGDCSHDPFVLNYLEVRLRRPLDGRRILGGPRLAEAGYRTREGEPVAPRVIGLRFADARQVLRAQGFKVRRFGRAAGVVSFQSPPPETRVTPSLRTVRLTLGRHNFHARRLRRCIASPGLRVLAGRPTIGDEDAPDLELALNGSQAGLVALYADPARARDNAPELKRRARKAHAIVTRHGRVTILWNIRPPAELRSRVLGCVAGARP
jgi:hypothetical protein